MPQPFKFIDSSNEIRSCGCLPRTVEIAVGASAEENLGVWTRQDCIDVIKAKSERRIDVMKREGFLPVFTKKANQGSTSGCNGGATANNYTLARYFGGIKDMAVYSGAYNYSLMNGGRDSGSVLADGRRTASQNGFVTVEVCPWSMIFRGQTKQFDSLAAENKAPDPYPARTELGLLTSIAKDSFGTVCIEAGPHIETPDHNGIAGMAAGAGNHAVTIVDCQIMGTDTPVYTLYLDWGPNHGQGGFCNVTWDSHLAQTCNYHLFWVLPVGQGQ